MITVEFGAPFDEALATVERHLAAGEYVAAEQLYRELLPLAEHPFLKAYLLTNLGMVQIERADLAGGLVSHERAVALLLEFEAAATDPMLRQLGVDLLLKALIGQGDLLRKAGDLAAAQSSLDQAVPWLAEFDGDGTREAELANVRALVLMSRGEWAAAEEVALAAEPTAYLLTTLALICAGTGRLDEAEDYLGQLGDEPHVIGHRGYVALRRGEFELAEQLYTQASLLFEQRRQPVELAVCEQARALLAGPGTRAEELLAASLERFERHGLAVAAADAALLASQHAYARGDIAEMMRLSTRARAVYEAQGIHDRCAQTDFLTAASIEEGLNRSAYGENEAAAVDSALALAIPAALALESMRCEFTTGHARQQWLALAEEAMRLAFRLAARRGDPGLMFELVEFRCAGVPLARIGEVSADPAFPDTATKNHTRPDAALAGSAVEVAASVGLRVSEPPQVLMSPGRVALREYLDAAQQRYRRRIVSEETVRSW